MKEPAKGLCRASLPNPKFSDEMQRQLIRRLVGELHR